MTQNTFDFVGLLDLDAHADRIDRGFYENTFVLVTRYRQRVQEDFLRSTIEDYLELDPNYIEMALRSLNLGLVMTFHDLDYRVNERACKVGPITYLRREVLKSESRSQCRSDCGEVWSQDIRLQAFELNEDVL